jgi:hypothetical protein
MERLYNLALPTSYQRDLGTMKRDPTHAVFSISYAVYIRRAAAKRVHTPKVRLPTPVTITAVRHISIHAVNQYPYILPSSGFFP